MRIVGAVCACAAAATTGSGLLGILAGAAAGLGLAFVFGVLTLTLAANQVATGLALTIFGLGLSSLLGAGFVGIPVAPLPKLDLPGVSDLPLRSEEHTSELQSLMRISYAVFCLKKKKKKKKIITKEYKYTQVEHKT